MPEFSGLKITQDANSAAKYPDLRLVRLLDIKNDPLVLDQPGSIGWGFGSGFHAFNLTVQFGADPILLVGFDCRTDRGVHWHGSHRTGLRNPSGSTAKLWVSAFERALPKLKGLGITVLNASADSALECFPKVDLAEALSCVTPPA